MTGVMPVFAEEVILPDSARLNAEAQSPFPWPLAQPNWPRGKSRGSEDGG